MEGFEVGTVGADKADNAVAMIVGTNGLPSLSHEIGASEKDKPGKSRAGYQHCCEGWFGDDDVVEAAGPEVARKKQLQLVLVLVGGVSLIVVGVTGCQTEVPIDGDRNEVLADSIPLLTDKLSSVKLAS
ncbi:hypothetical protein BGZ91_010646 [Linnemannia elongata]|nr:hypothetical protein BGZ91_010646 [Linnemannia elongata]